MQVVQIVKTVDRDMLELVTNHSWGFKTKAGLEKWYRSGHSPLYIQRFILLCTAEKSVMEQLRTHEKNGCQFYCDSGRPDTGNNTDGNNRSSMRNFSIDCNAQNLIDMAKSRLCNNAEKPTRMFMKLIKQKMRQVDIGLSNRMIVKCLLSAEGCTEFKSCGMTPYKPLVKKCN